VADLRPYRDLFIYLIEGRVEETEIRSEEAYLGNWLEDAYSFLFFQRPSAGDWTKCEL
jgi:ribosomal protein L11 methyltransferase